MRVLTSVALLGVHVKVAIARLRHRGYATADARLAVVPTSCGWLVTSHVARPGKPLAGHDIRLQVLRGLVAEADAQQIVVYARTRDERLARIYTRSVPGLRVFEKQGRHFLLVRMPIGAS